MKRREFIVGLGGSVAWPMVTLAQQDAREKELGVLMPFGEHDPKAKSWLSSFRAALRSLGWGDTRKLRTEVRWANDDVAQMRKLAKDLVELNLDVILASGTPATAALHRETSAIPIVFVNVVDPVGPGFITSLSRPGGNITGFTNIEAGMAGKWMQLLRELVPGVQRVEIVFNPDTAPYVRPYLLPPLEAAARSIAVESIAAPVRGDDEIEQVVASLGRTPGGALIVSADGFMFAHRASIISLAARYKVTAIYQFSEYVKDGGLLSYGPDSGDGYRRAASYVDRVLRGAKPSDLPVQLPVKFEMALNAKTAKQLGLTVPQSILLSADEVIE